MADQYPASTQPLGVARVLPTPPPPTGRGVPGFRQSQSVYKREIHNTLVKLMSKGVVSKSEFAAMCNVTPAAVANWIARGKIGPEALVGAGRSARIDVDVAIKHLQERLDVNQRFGLNGVGTKLDLAAPLLDRAPAPDAPPSVEEQIKREKLRQAQLATARLEEQDRLARGLYCNAVAVREQMVKIPARVLAAFEGSLPDVAAALAAKYRLPARDLLHEMRAQNRKLRVRVAAEFAAQADAEPETVEDDMDNAADEGNDGPR